MSINHQTRRNKKPTAAESWSNLPDDIINLIAENVYYYADYADQVRFRAVCKSWRSASFPLKHSYKIPWLFCYNVKASNTSTLSYLYDTTSRIKYAVKTELTMTELVGAKVRASKYGWVLFSKTTINSSPFSSSSCNSFPSLLFFYNPFTAETIELPGLHMISSSRATFSAAPTSSHCVVFVLTILYSSGRICINTCKPGQQRWTKHLFDGYYGDLNGMTYMKGFLYCSFSNNGLGAFNAATNTWKILWHERIRPHYVYRCGGLIESHDGHLLTLFLDCDHFQWRVFRFDWLKRKWFQVENLHNRALLLGCTSMSVAAVEEASELANTINSTAVRWGLSDFFKRWEDQKLSCPQSGDLKSVWVQPPLKRENGIRISNIISITSHQTTELVS